MPRCASSFRGGTFGFDGEEIRRDLRDRMVNYCRACRYRSDGLKRVSRTTCAITADTLVHHISQLMVQASCTMTCVITVQECVWISYNFSCIKIPYQHILHLYVIYSIIFLNINWRCYVLSNRNKYGKTLFALDRETRHDSPSFVGLSAYRSFRKLFTRRVRKT